MPLSKAVARHLEMISDLSLIEAEFTSAAAEVARRLAAGGTLYAFGNGGSAADAQHLVAELVGRFLDDREPIPAVVLPGDTSSLTCIANDYSFSDVFARPVRALVNSRDVVIGFSTSGNSANVLAGLQQAREKGAYSVLFSGQNAESTGADAVLRVPSQETARIQEAHVLLLHVLCQVIEAAMAAALPTATST